MTQPQDRVALVTGGSRGIGRAIATALGHSGYAVAVNYVRNAAAADEVVREITTAGSRPLAVRGDVGDAPDRRPSVPQTPPALRNTDLLGTHAGLAPDVRPDIPDP